jgi:YVTN family beta-propeller protein
MNLRTVFGLIAIASCVIATIMTVGCSTPTQTTLSQYNSVLGDGSTPTAVNDPSAITTLNYSFSTTAIGCYADGGPQPPTPPSPLTYWWGNDNIGSSPAAGECQFSNLQNGYYPIEWYSGACDVLGFPAYYDNVQLTSGTTATQSVCDIPAWEAPSAGTHFSITGSFPASVTVGGAGLTTTYGMPKLLIYNSSLTLEATQTATSVAGNGSSATFPFPTSLGQGTYMFAVKNLMAGGLFKIVDTTYYSIGSNPALSSAFGIDAADTTQTIKCNGQYTIETEAVPAITQYYSNQLVYAGAFGNGGGTYSVGSQPLAVKLYGTHIWADNSPNCFQWWHGPANALVVNSGSNSVTIVNFVDGTTTNIGVGTQPMGVALTSSIMNPMAYVVNYGSGTLSEVNLSTLAVSRTATVASGVQSVAMDPGGSYVWVGGTNYLYKVSLSTFTVVGSYSVSGTVTSLAASSAQNELVYTLVQNCCSGSSTYSANELLLSNMTSPGTYASGSASAYAPYTMNGTLPSAASLPQATTVSAQFGNGVAASSTPTGFVVYDVVSHKQLMAGTTPTPVRGIASDAQNLVVYFTVPDSNEYVIVPMPHL